MIGIDIAKIARFSEFSHANFNAGERIFSQDEWDECFAKPKPAMHLAGKFAAKEAIIKAMGTDFANHTDLNKVIISNDTDGRPFVNLKIKQSIQLSISHDGDYAIAIAIKTND